jgi:D-amino peptidase
MTDLEGVSGVVSFSQTVVSFAQRRESYPPLNIQAREYFMGDLTAVVRGLRDAGASEILVVDGHGSGAVVPHLMAPGAKYMVGRPLHFPSGLDKTYSGLIFVGQHAMMGTPDGVLHHTQTAENRYWYNGVESGELAQYAAMAGHFGVPPIMVTGDEAACREATKFFGADCVTVSVKKGLAREAAILYPFAETRKALYEGAKRAVAAIPRCKPYQMTLPIKAKMQFLVLDKSGASHLETKEGTIDDVLHLLDF